ncbi:uncharacterized protein LOC124298570 isoform X1 [Neodiprion virginianus]|uniref:uncharacterized protein LOC124298570 isoform X1 n=1 Tax=Neodiprion virginianus TaxID=2961670 RepID=UPI001EE75B78|nr:uncharacterized protein LOC124298570 isoform X1 [Neodiprion virginianus]
MAKITAMEINVMKQLQQRHDAAGSAKVHANATRVKSRSRKCCRPQRRLNRSQVLKMQPRKQPKSDQEAQSVASDGVSSGAVSPGAVPNGETSKQFLSTGRTGRRNALPDILGHHADTDTADLPSRLEALTTETKQAEPSTSKDGASTSKQYTG